MDSDGLADYSFHSECDHMTSYGQRLLTMYSQLVLVYYLAKEVINCKIITAGEIQSLVKKFHLGWIESIVDDCFDLIAGSLDLYQFRASDIDAIRQDYDVATSTDQ